MTQPTSPEQDPIAAVVRELEAIPPVSVGEEPRWRRLAEADGRVAARAGGGRDLRRRGTSPGRRAPALRAAAAAAAVVAAGVLALVVVLVGGAGDDRSAPRATQARHATAALPVFTRPIADASATRADTPEVARRGAYYAEARAIATAYGRGYVVPAPDGWTCLIVPARPDGYGEGCASAEQIAERGLPVANVSFEDDGIMAAVLPPTATDATLHLADGTTHALPIDDGVITASASGRARVTFRIRDRPFTIKLYNDIRCIEGDPSYTPQELRRMAERMGTRVC